MGAWKVLVTPERTSLSPTNNGKSFVVFVPPPSFTTVLTTLIVAGGGTHANPPPVDATVHGGLATVLVIRVTAPFRANNLPLTLALAWSEMLSNARIFPLKIELVFNVAELPTCQKTLQA